MRYIGIVHAFEYLESASHGGPHSPSDFSRYDVTIMDWGPDRIARDGIRFSVYVTLNDQSPQRFGFQGSDALIRTFRGKKMVPTAPFPSRLEKELRRAMCDLERGNDLIPGTW